MELQSGRARRAHFIGQTAAFGVLALGIWALISAIRFNVQSFEPFAIADFWLPFSQLIQSPTFPPPIDYYWIPHGDHRIPLPRLLIVLDLIVDRGGGLFLHVCSYVAQILHACLIAWVVRRLVKDSWGAYLWITSLGVSLFALFNILNWENLIRPFQVCLLLGYFLATLALTIATLPEFRAWGATASALLAPGCFLSGWAVWPVMLAASAAAGRRWKTLAAMAGCGAIVAVLYFRGYHSSAAPLTLSNALSQKHLTFLFDMMGRPLSPFTRSPLAAATGGIIAIIALALIALPFIPSCKNEMRLWIAANVAFSLAGLLMISLGRFDQGFAWRYMTPVLLLWIFVAVGVGYELSRSKLGPVFSILALAACAWTSSLHSMQDFIRSEISDPFIYRARNIGAAYAVGVEYPSLGVQNYTAGTLQNQNMDRIRNQRLMLWQFSPYNRLGTTIPRPSLHCDGKIEGVRPMYSTRYPGFEVAGVSHRETHQVVLLDANDQVVGVSATRSRLLRRKWSAYLPASAAGSIITAVDVFSGTQPCLVAPPFQVEGDSRVAPVFTDRDRAGWLPVRTSETGELALPHAITLDASGLAGKPLKSVIVHVRLERENYVSLNVPYKLPMIAYVPVENHWVYVIFNVNRDEQDAGLTPMFDTARIDISYTPPVMGKGWIDGAWITRERAPPSDQDTVVYLDGSNPR